MTPISPAQVGVGNGCPQSEKVRSVQILFAYGSKTNSLLAAYPSGLAGLV